MAVNSELIETIKASQLPKIPNPTTGDLIHAQGDDLSTTSLQFFIEKINNGYNGTMSNSLVIPSMGYYRYKVVEPGTYTNVTPNITVSPEEIKKNYVVVAVINGVAEKELDPKPENGLDVIGSTYDDKIDFASLIDNSYINEDNGDLIKNITGFKATNFISIISNKRYIMPPLYKQFAFYDKNFNYISDSQSKNSSAKSGVISIVSPVNSAYIRMTLAESDGIDNYYLKLNECLLPVLFSNNTITVRKEGGNFNSIQSAIAYADTRGRKQFIEIDSGEYIEELRLVSGMSHALIGQSKESVIITNYLGDLYEPIKVKGGWYFQDIQVRNVGRGYAVHADYAGAGEIEFNNCKIVTHEHAAIGSGSHQDQTLRLRNCELKNTGDYIGSGLLYWHNNVNSGVTNQRLEVINCILHSIEEMSLRIEDANLLSGDGLGNEAKVLFIGNNLFSEVWKKNIELKPSGTAFVGNSIFLDERSYGNNIMVLNK
ncbi:hypothetical protein HZP84_16335 [Elizabethkingia anophelis]|nr:hypothetical protein [Elizabethkingia anophelis]MCT3824617.1 hypothetical protein [Elizabethkingia anophelis]MCT3931910.1 hypothetical protein [Elizabethkingia anophelis]MCT4078031.1 hypothetical protein [Elizabethkingia anophelis]MCT4081696.1 hypothetical protein [Elizabethkingia anophelis]